MTLLSGNPASGKQRNFCTRAVQRRYISVLPVRPCCLAVNTEFFPSSSEMDLITRRILKEMEQEGRKIDLKQYVNPDTAEYAEMVDRIGRQLNFTSLRFHRLDDMIASVGIDKSKLCTYCWDGEEG